MNDIFLRAQDAASPAEERAILGEADVIMTRHLERALRAAGIPDDAPDEQILEVRFDGEIAESLERELAALRDRLDAEGRRRRRPSRGAYSSEVREHARMQFDALAGTFIFLPPLAVAAGLVAWAVGEFDEPGALLGGLLVWALFAPIALALRRWARWGTHHARAEAAAATDFVLLPGTFEAGERIPSGHAADGGNVSPPLFWSAPPPGTAELVLVMYRRDRKLRSTGSRTHWLGWGIDPSARELAAGEAAPTEGRNDLGTVGYHGPTGEPSLYFFVLYAVGSELGLPAGAIRATVEEALCGRVLGSASTLGR